MWSRFIEVVVPHNKLSTIVSCIYHFLLLPPLGSHIGVGRGQEAGGGGEGWDGASTAERNVCAES